MEVPVAPFPEQVEVVRRVEAVFRLTNVIERRVAATVTKSEQLTRAVLAKAFRGELVPTEAELARREGRDYESAAVLIERVSDERSQAQVRGRRERRARQGAEQAAGQQRRRHE